MYDSSGRQIGRVDSERYYDSSGRQIGRVDGLTFMTHPVDNLVALMEITSTTHQAVK